DERVEDGEELDDEAAAERLSCEADRSFDLAQGPVVRLRLLRRPRGWAVLFAVHHIGVDFASLAVLLDELGAVYGALVRGDAPQLPELRSCYRDFVAWQQMRLAGPAGERSFAAWQARLAGSPPGVDLPGGLPRPRLQSFRGGVLRATVGKAEAEALRALARRTGVNPGDVLLAAFAALVHRHTGSLEVAIGCPVPGRGGDERFRDLVGYFVNSVVVRADLAGRPTYRELVSRVGRLAAEAREHGDYPFPLLDERLRLPRDPSRPPLFQLFFAYYEGYEERALRLLSPDGSSLHLGDLALRPLPLARRAAMFDLSLFAGDSGEAIELTFQYGADLFTESAIATLVGDFAALLTAALRDPERPVAALPASLGAAALPPPSAIPAAPAAVLAASRDRADTRRAHLERQKQLRSGTSPKTDRGDG
ncbi:MAG TPA: condensation domain-containing protein, partial [Thermoanaerobaculia bacterium]